MEDNKRNAHTKQRYYLWIAFVVFGIFWSGKIVTDRLDLIEKTEDFHPDVRALYYTYNTFSDEELCRELEDLLGSEYYQFSDVTQLPESVRSVDYINNLYKRAIITQDCRDQLSEHRALSRIHLISVYDRVWASAKIIDTDVIESSEGRQVIRFEIRLDFHEYLEIPETGAPKSRLKYVINTGCTMTKVKNYGQWQIDKLVFEDILPKWKEVKGMNHRESR